MSWEDLPLQRKGVVPQGRGRYPDYDVLSQADHWDEVTRRMILDRIHDVPPIHCGPRGSGLDDGRTRWWFSKRSIRLSPRDSCLPSRNW